MWQLSAHEDGSPIARLLRLGSPIEMHQNDTWQVRKKKEGTAVVRQDNSRPFRLTFFDIQSVVSRQLIRWSFPVSLQNAPKRRARGGAAPLRSTARERKVWPWAETWEHLRSLTRKK